MGKTVISPLWQDDDSSRHFQTGTTYSGYRDGVGTVFVPGNFNEFFDCEYSESLRLFSLRL